MNKVLLHTPDGVRDIYGSECSDRLIVRDKIHEKMKLYGYEDIETPTFEFFDVFAQEINASDARELYKFFDKDGKYAYIRHNTNACSRAFDLFLVGRIKLDDYITIKNAIYGMIWPDEIFDLEHANELDVCMDRIKKKCQHVADSNRRKYHYNM